MAGGRAFAPDWLDSPYSLDSIDCDPRVNNILYWDVHTVAANGTESLYWAKYVDFRELTELSTLICRETGLFAVSQANNVLTFR